MQSRGLGADQGETEGPNPESGAVAKALHQHPVMKFLAISAATMAGMVIGGQLIRQGGVRLAVKLQDTNKPWVTNAVHSIRQIQQELDSLQGVQRTFADGGDYSTSSRLFVKDTQTGAIEKDRLTRYAGYEFTDAQKAGKKNYAKNKFGIESPEEWYLKDEIQRRLVGQARRLPYELPAVYIAQRGITDKLFGSQDDKKVNWSNPVDVVTDFVNTSVRNLTTMILPFEAGVGTASHSWTKFMSMGDNFMSLPPSQQGVGAASVVLKDVLERVGHDVTDVVNKVVKISSQSTGALATGIEAARSQSKHPVEFYHDIRNKRAAGISSGQQKIVKRIKDQAPALDMLPGPFKGMYTGVTAGRARFNEIGRGHEAFDNLMRLGKTKFEAGASSFDIKNKNTWKFDQDALRSISGVGNNPIEELATQLQTLGGGGSRSGAWKQSTFFQDQMRVEYQKLIKQRLDKAGLSKKAQDTIYSKVDISAPTGVDKHLSNRIHFGKKAFDFRGEQEVIDELGNRLSRISDTDRVTLSANLRSSIEDADREFLSNATQNRLSQQIEQRWHLASDQVVSQHAERLFKKPRLPFNQFIGDIDPAAKKFLERKTASMTGMKLTDEFGNLAHGQDINDHLVKMGFANKNGQNYDKMRAYLTTEKVINKPWNKGSANIFGLRSVTASEGIDRGYFRSGPYAEDEVKRISARMQKNDPLAYGGYDLAGVYQTASGRVVDFTRIKNSATGFLDKLSASTQIPLIHVSPLQLFGYSGAQGLREKAILQYVSGTSSQKFLPGGDAAQHDFYLWMRNKGRGSKGSVFGFGKAPDGKYFGNQFKGQYRPFDANSQSLESNIIKIAGGDSGYAPRADAPKMGKLGQLKKIFDVNDRQPDSLINLAGRWRRRSFDLNNPVVISKLLADGEVTRKGKTVLRMQGDSVVDGSGNEVMSAAESFRKFSSGLRRFGYSERAVKGLETAQGGKYKHLFGFDFTGMGAKTFDGEGFVHFSGLKTPAQLREASRLMIKKDSGAIKSLPRDQRGAAESAQKALLWPSLKKSGDPSMWGRTTPGSAQSTTIHTAQDAMRADMFKYLAVRRSLTGSQDFNKLMPEIMSELAVLRSVGKINQAEFSEARTALLSTQINFQSFKTYIPGGARVDSALSVMGAISRSGGSTKEVLQDLAEGRVGALGRGRSVKPLLRRKMGVGDYEYSGTEYNPFGKTDSVFVPTFSTAFERDPLGATGSVLGFGTWKNQQAFSGSSIPASHFVNRLNKYAGTLGGSLDPTKYGGPVSLLAQGMVLKRALPLVAGGTVAMTADRTLGGYINDKDANGDRVYSPYVLGKLAGGVVEGEARIAGLVPGGQSYQEKKDQLTEGEVPIRAGRWWPLGSTPWRGGRIQNFRPSWYRRLQSGYNYTDEAQGTPLERLAFGYDYSPLRPLDPYRFERKHYEDRPYPMTGEYFTGPWGPLTPALNMTLGKVLKPQFRMHKDEVQAGLGSYMPVGQAGAYLPSSGTTGGYPGTVGGSGDSYSGGSSGLTIGGAGVGAVNASYAAAGQHPLGTASNLTTQAIGSNNSMYASAAYGTPNIGTGVLDPRVIGGAPPLNPSDISYQLGDIGYKSQELLGIYGFMFASARDSLGFGSKDFDPDRPVLASASAAYGSTRGFWDLNLGGLGDAPLPIEGNFANLEFSEIVRRFIPKERSGTEVVNPILNPMGFEHPWLPGDDYYLNFKRGDPYTTVQEGEMRLPGKGYQRFNTLNPDKTGSYGLVDKHKILGDVAPWSAEYRAIDSEADNAYLSNIQRSIIETTRSQVAAKAVKNEFTPYEYKYDSIGDTIENPPGEGFGKFREWLGHRNTYFNTKFMQERTAVEDWERENVYGATFPQWQTPVESFLQPMVNNASQRNPMAAGLLLGAVGSLFGRGAPAKAVTSVIGGAVGVAAGAYGNIYERLTGDRFVPKSRRREIALEENIDILTYVKNMHLSNQAKMSGDMESASTFKSAAQQTMYGADIYNGDLSQIAQSIPKRKREHFKAMLSAPVQERGQILSTAGRLERRILQGAWGMPVEERPDLQEYFQDHELPAENWEGFHPNTNMDHIKIKMGQSLGIQMSEMGYYPQQIREANLINPSYPNFQAKSSGRSVSARLRQLMYEKGINGDIIPIRTPYGGTRVSIDQGIFSGV